MNTVYNNPISNKKEFDKKFIQFLEKIRLDQRGRFSVLFPEEQSRKIDIVVWIKPLISTHITTPSLTIDETYSFSGPRKNSRTPPVIKHLSWAMCHHPRFKTGSLKPFYIDYNLDYDGDSVLFIEGTTDFIKNRYKQIEKEYKQPLKQLYACVVVMKSIALAVALIGIASIGAYFY